MLGISSFATIKFSYEESAPLHRMKTVWVKFCCNQPDYDLWLKKTGAHAYDDFDDENLFWPGVTADEVRSWWPDHRPPEQDWKCARFDQVNLVAFRERDCVYLYASWPWGNHRKKRLPYGTLHGEKAPGPGAGVQGHLSKDEP